MAVTSGELGGQSEGDPIIDALLERQARVDEDLAALRYLVARRKRPLSHPPIASRLQDQDDPVNRREFLAYGLLFSGSAALDVEAMTAAVLGVSTTDGSQLDQFRVLTDGYHQQYDTTPPRELLRTVRVHLLCLRALPLPTSTRLRKDLESLIGKTSVLAGRLSQRVHNRADAEEFLGLAEGMAREAGDGHLLGLALAAKSSLHSNIDSGRPLGRPPVAIALSTEALRVAGNGAPPSFRSWALAHRAEEFAAAGDALAADRDIEAAESALNRPGIEGDGLFRGWGADRLDGYRGCCGVLLGRRDVLSALELALVQASPQRESQRSAITIDLATAYARQGEIDHAATLLSETLETAVRSHLPEMVRRLGTVRRFEFQAGKHESIERLDEQLRSAALAV